MHATAVAASSAGTRETIMRASAYAGKIEAAMTAIPIALAAP